MGAVGLVIVIFLFLGLWHLFAPESVIDLSIKLENTSRASKKRNRKIIERHSSLAIGTARGVGLLLVLVSLCILIATASAP